MPLATPEADLKLTKLFLAEFERQGARSRGTLEQYPEGKNDWKPHEKSMMFGYLVQLVASMPSWVAMHHSRVESLRVTPFILVLIEIEG